MNKLEQRIHEAIAVDGVISFRRFMEMALYEPELGYYEQQREIGRSGDFYTSVSVGSVFGELLGFQFAEWLGDVNGEVNLIEAGAHEGRLAKDILDHLAEWRPDVYARTRLILLEPSARHRQWQKEILAAHAEKISWNETIPDSFRGIFFCNELLDAFPAQKFEWSADEQIWFECGVGQRNGQFEWRRMEAIQADWKVDKKLPDGTGMVHVPALAPFWNQVCSSLSEGRAAAIDYFLDETAFFTPPRPSGTLRTYHAHRQAYNLLANVGEQDLTASVNLDELKFAAKAAGLSIHPLSTQAQWLVKIFEQTLKMPDVFPEWAPERTRQFQTLVHPEHLGHSFKVFECERP